MVVANDSGVSLSWQCRVLAFLGGAIILAEIAIVSRWERMENYPSFARDFEAQAKYGKVEAGRLKENIATVKLVYERWVKNLTKELGAKLKNATDKKLILVWIPMFGARDSRNINRDKCGNCDVTYDRGMINDKRTGAVVFHFDALKQSNVPDKRNPNHLHIYWDMESTSTLRITRGVTLDFEETYGFNATMTYRRDSDFYFGYDDSATASDIVRDNKLSLQEMLQQKSKTAIAVVSNCGITVGSRKRITMLRELQNAGLQLDTFGGCFGKRLKNEEFRDEVRKHKFYFSFENSHYCKDYITEKFFSNALRNNAVPVVWGATKEDYEAVAPPGSFIFAEDFASMTDLADYLNSLDKNDTAYLSYLRWLTLKPEEMPQYGRAHGFCSVCRAIHGINIDDLYSPKYIASNPVRPVFTDGIAPRTVLSIKKWFYGEDNAECFKTNG